mmetsp:Transcript_10890/g.25594  ORF Transcript_10890/g.25594 Transcript_10890/m.25594 type:complete len:224 (-) Transcript_10890:79-750(-)
MLCATFATGPGTSRARLGRIVTNSPPRILHHIYSSDQVFALAAQVSHSACSSCHRALLVGCLAQHLQRGKRSRRTAMSSTVTTRPVVDADFAAWSALWTHYLTFYKTARDEAQHRQTWSRIMDPAVKMYAQVAELDGEIVGIVNYVHHQYFWGPEDRIYLNDLYTVPAARGRGVGRALIAAVKAHASEAGAGQVWWLTAEDNTAARLLYDKVATLSPFRQYKI